MTAEAWITGTPPNQKINFRLPTGGKGPKGDAGPAGRDGSNVVPTADAITTEIKTAGSSANNAVLSLIATKSPKFKAAASDLDGSRRPGNLRAGSKRVEVAPGFIHNAFPGMAVCKDGTVLFVWRAATSHEPSTPGVIRARRYAANGTPLGSEYIVLADGLDLRDPMLTVLKDGRLVMQYFKHDGTANTKAGVFVAVSEDDGRTFTERSKVPFTWDTLIASSGRMIVAPNGDWLVSGYGRNSNTFQRINLMRSTDEGFTWAGEVVVAEGQTESRNYMEPVLGTRPDGSLMCLIRVADSTGTNPSIYSTTSTDNGLTWTAETLIVTASGGRPAWISLASGGILLVSRSTVAPNPMQFRMSWDNGATWSAATQLGASPASQGTYAQPVEVAPGLIGVVWGIEANPASSSNISWGYLADGYGWSPMGDDFNSVAPAYPADYMAVDTFTRPNAATLGTTDTGQVWTNHTGAIGITSNLAQTVAGSGTSLSTFDSGVPDGDITVAMRWSAGGLSGNGLVTRFVDINTHIYATIESAGTALRVKKVSGGTITGNLIDVSGLSFASETWHIVRITWRGNTVKVYVNGTLIGTGTLTAAEMNTYGSATRVGLRATLDGHRFGNFTDKRGFLDLPTLV